VVSVVVMTMWDKTGTHARTDVPPHFPSKVAREGDIRNLVPCHGIEDRGDGHDAVGGKYLASTALARR